MVSSILKVLLISLSGLANCQVAPTGISMSWSTSSASAETHSGSTEIHFIPDNPTNSTGLNPSGGSNPSNSTRLPKKSGGRKLAAYYPVYNAKGQPVSELRFDLYDELIFFAATTTANFTIGTDSLDQNEWDSLAFEFVDSCRKNSVLPTYSIGGWGGSRYFSSLVATAENRTAFADSTIAFAKKYGFGGIEVDWEYPCIQGIGCNVVSDQDVQNQQLLFKEIKTKWPEGKLSSTGSIAGIRDSNYQKLPASDVTIMVQTLDELRIMAYDVHGSFTKTTGPNAPLRGQCADPENQLSIESAFDIYIKQGFKPEQLVLGIPGYAKSWTLASSNLTPRVVGNYTSYYYQNYTAIPPGGNYDDRPRVDVCGNRQGWGGSWLVSELVENGFLDQSETSGGNGYTKYFDACSGEPFLASNTTLITYDDTESTVSKVLFAKSKNLAGVFFFDSMGPMPNTVSAARQALLN